MNRGRVKWFNNEKGYGFIEYDGMINEDIFVHYSAIDQDGYKSLNEGDIVEFTLIETAKGNQAINVKEVALTSV
jgi:cold shock protein